MSKRRLAWITLVVIGAITGCGALWSALGPDKIVLTTAQLQERINKALRREFKGISIQQATVTVAESRVALRVEVSATALGQAFRAVVTARGVPRYDSEHGEIFFDAEDVKVLDLAPAGGNLADRFDRLGGALRQRVETAAGSAIAAGLRAYLAARPVYRFKDDIKGIVLRAAISDVTTQTDAIVVNVSLVNLTVTVAIFLTVLLAIVFLIVQLVRHPRWGLVILDVATDVALQ
jgi:hypothetical protein